MCYSMLRDGWKSLASMIRVKQLASNDLYIGVPQRYDVVGNWMAVEATAGNPKGALPKGSCAGACCCGV